MILMITIRELLTQKGYSTENIHENILNLETDCTQVADTDRYCPIIGYKLTNENDNTEYIINLEDNEFAPFVKSEIRNNLYLETGYDTELNKLYAYEDGEEVEI